MMSINYNYNNYRNSYIKILKYMFLLTLYYGLVKCPYLPYSYELIPHIEVRQIVVSVVELVTVSVLFNASLAILTLTIFGNFLAISNYCYHYSLSSVKEIDASTNVIYHFINNLDISNPFLYAYKTRALLE